jgi:5,10-methylene-tetrahydrofolate dehydrogenase/methenyl tetrahydrofolate cyclohydrolase
LAGGGAHRPRLGVDKDADGFSAANVGNMCLRGGAAPLALPCTPAGVVELLRRYEVPLAGAHVVVLGRSNIVGMPVAQMLQACDATVTVCHSRTVDVAGFVRRADIVVAAIGLPGFVRADWLKPGCVVVDVGINAVDDASAPRGYRLVGDVDFEAAMLRASKITPVPGGVGPMTIAMLMRNTVNLARHAAEQRRTANPNAAD